MSPVIDSQLLTSHRLHPVTGARRIKVTFNSATSEALPWTFTPQQKSVWVLPGETSLAFYTAKNTSTEDIIGIATYNVLPDRVSSITTGHFWIVTEQCLGSPIFRQS
jgi:cytochrome c oxidase assembly protein subunit 11